MNQTTHTREEALVSILTAEATPLARVLKGSESPRLVEARGALTPAFFSDEREELSALMHGVAVFDAGSRVRLRVSGEDRVRWLNGMVTNTVKGLAAGTHNYTFVLNAQGRIQGDATIFAFTDYLVFETDRAQAERLHAHLDRFIIMDDVELAWIEGQTTLGLAGPGSEQLLASLGLPVPKHGSFVTPADRAVTVVGEESPSIRRFSLWVAEQDAVELWQQLTVAGAAAAGAIAVDTLRVIEGTPLYGVDITEKTLSQETGQTRALNFNKGCYLGQEIVERVRSRANVHRAIRQFALRGQPARVGASLTLAGATVGELTSVASITLASAPDQFALGTLRTEAIAGSLTYAGGSAEALSSLPILNPASPQARI